MFGSARDLQISAQPVDKLQKDAGFGLDDAFHHDLSSSIHDRDRNAFLVNVHADIFGASHSVRIQRKNPEQILFWSGFTAGNWATFSGGMAAGGQSVNAWAIARPRRSSRLCPLKLTSGTRN